MEISVGSHLPGDPRFRCRSVEHLVFSRALSPRLAPLHSTRGVRWVRRANRQRGHREYASHVASQVVWHEAMRLLDLIQLLLGSCSWKGRVDMNCQATLSSSKTPIKAPEELALPSKKLGGDIYIYIYLNQEKRIRIDQNSHLVHGQLVHPSRLPQQLPDPLFGGSFP